MGLFTFLMPRAKKEKTAKTPEVSNANINYSALIEMADIISNGDKQVRDDFTMLVQDYHSFYEKHRLWCEEILDCVQKDDYHTILLVIFSYWLTGYNTDFNYGSYIDWKEEPEEIVRSLTNAICNLRYPLSLDHLNLNDEIDTWEAMKKIDTHFRESGYILTRLDTDSDCYHLFIIKCDVFIRLQELGRLTGFMFISLIDL